MVIYTKETKTLIIPEGLGNLQSGNCDGVYREGFDNGYSSGYTSGHTDGYQEGLAADCGEAIETAYDNGYGDGYTSGTTDGYNDGYGDGYAQGQSDCSGSSCELMIGTVDLENGDSGQWVRYPDEGYDGFRQVRIYDRGYGQGKYDQGYQDGLANCPECPTVDCASAVTEAYQSGYTAGLNDCSGSTDCSSAITAAYNEGYADGEQEGAEAGYNNGYREGYEDGIEDCGAYSACPIQVYKEISLQDTEIDIYPDQGYVGVGQLHIDAAQYGNSKYGEGYEDGTTDGFNSGYTSGTTDGYASGYTAGLADCSGDTCNLQYKEITVDATNYSGAYIIHPDSGYQGFYEVGLNAAQWTEDMYNSGYTDGRAATGTDRTYALEVTFSTQNSYFASVSGANIKVTTLVHPDDYLVGTAKPSFFDYTYFNEDFDYQNNIATYQFVGQWRYGNPSGQVQGNVTPTCLFIDVLKNNTNNWGDFYCTKVRFNPNVTIENGVAVFESETGFEYIPVETYNNHIDDTDPRFEQVQIDWNQQVLCNNCTEAYEEGQGSVGTLEFTFEGNLPSVGWMDEPVITAEMYSGNTYVGQYMFNYSGNGFDMTAENAYPGTKDVKSFSGYFEGQGLPDPTYLDIRSIGIDVYTSYLNSWSNWTLSIRVNGRPRYRRSAGQIIEFRGVTTGGFKITPSAIDTSSTGYTPNTTHVVATL